VDAFSVSFSKRNSRAQASVIALSLYIYIHKLPTAVFYFKPESTCSAASSSAFSVWFRMRNSRPQGPVTVLSLYIYIYTYILYIYRLRSKVIFRVHPIDYTLRSFISDFRCTCPAASSSAFRVCLTKRNSRAQAKYCSLSLYIYIYIYICIYTYIHRWPITVLYFKPESTCGCL